MIVASLQRNPWSWILPNQSDEIVHILFSHCRRMSSFLPRIFGHGFTGGLSKVVRKSCARCVLDVSCTTLMLGVVVVAGSVFFACAAWICKDVGAGKSDFKIHSRHSLSIPFKKCHYSEPVRTNTCEVYDPVCCLSLCLLLPRWGWAGQTSRGPRATSRYDTACPRCVTVFAGANSRVKYAVPLGPTLSFRDACALRYLRCAIVFSCSNPLKYLTRLLYNIEMYYSVRKESDEISLFRKGFVAKRVPMVF